MNAQDILNMLEANDISLDEIIRLRKEQKKAEKKAELKAELKAHKYKRPSKQERDQKMEEEQKKAELKAHKYKRPSKQERDQKMEEVFRRDRNTKWAIHTGNPDAETWYNNGGRMPEELELEVIELKKQNYLLDEIFQLFDTRKQEILKMINHTETFEEWFDKTLTQGGRVKRPDIFRRADNLTIRKKDLFQLLEKRCGKAVKKSGNVWIMGWSLKSLDTLIEGL